MVRIVLHVGQTGIDGIGQRAQGGGREHSPVSSVCGLEANTMAMFNRELKGRVVRSVQLVEALPHRAGEPGSILTLSAVYMGGGVAHSPGDSVGFLRTLGIPPTSQRHVRPSSKLN